MTYKQNITGLQLGAHFLFRNKESAFFKLSNIETIYNYLLYYKRSVN